MQMTCARLSWCLAAVAVCFAGCGGEHKTYPVTGTIKFKDGSPLPVGRIYLETRDKRYGDGMGIYAMGRLKEDGSFVMGTYGVDDGAPPGQYAVHIRGAGRDTGRRAAALHTRRAIKTLIHKKYASSRTTDIKVEVKPGENHFDIVVDPP